MAIVAIVAKTMMTVPEQRFLLPQHLSWLPVPVGMVPSLYGGAPLPTRCRRARCFDDSQKQLLCLALDMSDSREFFY